MTAKQLKDLKEQQEKDQDAALDDLIDTVRNIKTGNKGINKELKEQDVLLNVFFLIYPRICKTASMITLDEWARQKDR